MQLLEVIFIGMVFALLLFLAIGSYILQRDRYWANIWRGMGEPQIESISELRSLIKDQHEIAKPCDIAGYRPKKEGSLKT